MLTFTSSFFHILCRGCNIPADTPCGQLSHKAHTLTPWRPVLAAVWQARPCPCCKQPTMRPGTHPPCRHEMLRKKYHVVRKKNHVVRKIFYVASIFDGAAGRENGARADKKRCRGRNLPWRGRFLPRRGKFFPRRLVDSSCALPGTDGMVRKGRGRVNPFHG